MDREQNHYKKPAMPTGRGVYFAGIIVCIASLYIFNNLLNLYVLSIPAGSNIFKAIMGNAYTQIGIPFLSKNFINCLWSINLALGLGMMGNFALLFYRPPWFHYVLQAFLIAVSVLPVCMAYKIFPFVISSQSIQTLTKTGLIVLVAIMSAGCLFMLIKGAVIFIRTIRDFEPL